MPWAEGEAVAADQPSSRRCSRGVSGTGCSLAACRRWARGQRSREVGKA